MHDSGLVFISSHLSSGEHEGDELKRNYDYSEIIRRGYFADEFSALDPSVLGAHQQHAGVSKVPPTPPHPLLPIPSPLCELQNQLPLSMVHKLKVCVGVAASRGFKWHDQGACEPTAPASAAFLREVV